jgi:hypothetical protein
LEQANKDLDGVRKQYDTLKADFDKAKTDHAAELLGIQVDNVLASAKAGIKFKAELPQAATEALMANALNNIKGMQPEFVDDGNGGKKLQFKGANGEVLRDPENHLEAYTAEALLKKELRAMGVLDEGRKQQGGGTSPRQQQGGGGTAVDVSAARTQMEASEIIAKQLMQKGLINGSKQYQDEFSKAWTENNVQSLPMQ